MAEGRLRRSSATSPWFRLELTVANSLEGVAEK
jgi:hypothetical protein